MLEQSMFYGGGIKTYMPLFGGGSKIYMPLFGRGSRTYMPLFGGGSRTYILYLLANKQSNFNEEIIRAFIRKVDV